MSDNIISVVAAMIRDEAGRMLVVRKRGTEAVPGHQHGAFAAAGERLHDLLPYCRDAALEAPMDVARRYLRPCHRAHLVAPCASRVDHDRRGEVARRRAKDPRAAVAFEALQLGAG